MSAPPIPLPIRLAAPDLAARLRDILRGLAVVIATRLARTPLQAIAALAGLHLLGTARRFAALAAHVNNGRLPRQRTGKSRSGPCPARRPRQSGWLLRHGRHEAAYWRGQLETFLAEPLFAAFVVAAPTAGRLLRPVCHLLALKPPLLYPPRPQPPPAPESTPATPAPAAPEPAAPNAAARPFVPGDLPCPRLAARWPWRDLLAKMRS